MKHLLPILTLTLLFSQELEVEGDLKVTGTVESATIDSLQQIIANLQAQIDAMQADNKMETRIYPFPINLSSGTTVFEIDMYNITGDSLPTAILQVIGLDDYTFFDQVMLDYDCDGMNVSSNSMFDFYNGELTFYTENVYLENRNCHFISMTDNTTFNRNLFLAITAQFSD